MPTKQSGTDQTGTDQTGTGQTGTGQNETPSLGDTAQRAAEQLKETGRDALHGAKSVVDGAVSDLKAASAAKAEEMRGMVADEGQRMAQSLRDAAQQGGGGVQARVLDSVASGVSAVSDQLARHDLRHLMDDAVAFARRNPAIFVAGAALAGLVLARLAAQAGGHAHAHADGGPQAGDMGAGRPSGGMGPGGIASGGGGMMDDPTARGPSIGGHP
ncbi:MAG: hypothetical protein RIR62_1364 [Pseudomonadota bacterium]